MSRHMSLGGAARRQALTFEIGDLQEIAEALAEVCTHGPSLNKGSTLLAGCVLE